MPGAQTLGAQVRSGPSTRFALFSSHARSCSVRLFQDAHTPQKDIPMHAAGAGYHELLLEDVGHGALYKFVLDERELPDPYARFLPYGVHGPAMAVEPRYGFRHPRPAASRNPSVYELHVGTFTEHGTYAAASLRLAQLQQLGVTTLELMPVAAFPGDRGWGYDGVALFAPFAAYGTPDELRLLVDTAHGLGLRVLLDVVYNHFGPAGNYLSAYAAEYFGSGTQNAWGDGPNFAFAPMRALVRDNVRYWLEEFRFDGLRLDAVHAIVDRSERHIVAELIETARESVPHATLIAEDDRNDPALISELDFDAIWADDFHHQLHVTLTGESDGYYASYQPGVAALARCIERGWLYEGQTFALSERPRGKSADGMEASAFVYCLQNHDQVGNRALGERLSTSLSADAYRLASAVLLFLPMTPLLFMGQEWGATSPFLFFTDHEPELGAAVVRGRREEFKRFRAFADESARESIPDPQRRASFEDSKLRWQEREQPGHAATLALYEALLALRAEDAVLRESGRRELRALSHNDVLELRRTLRDDERVLFANFSAEPRPLPCEPAEGTVLYGALADGAKLPAHGFVILARKRQHERL